MSGDFLSRWSRRKQEARRAEPLPEAEAEEARPAAPSAETGTPEEPAGPPAEPALSAEEIAALPKLEDLTAASDLSAFLRKGVPEALRNAALRRMWSLDPAIRDFVGEARDYAYDWNAPGGVPGSGELLPGQDVRAMVRQIFGESEPGRRPDAQADLSPPAPSRHRDREEVLEADSPAEPSAVAPQPDGEDGRGDHAARSGPVEEARCRQARIGAEPRRIPAAAQQEPPDGAGSAASSRRHGGAKPA